MYDWLLCIFVVAALNVVLRRWPLTTNLSGAMLGMVIGLIDFVFVGGAVIGIGFDLLPKL